MTRIQKIAKKMDLARAMHNVAIAGLSSANRSNPFWNKSKAMKRLNEIRKYQRQLSKIWILEWSVNNSDIDCTINF